jgi:hypothetical protein
LLIISGKRRRHEGAALKGQFLLHGAILLKGKFGGLRAQQFRLFWLLPSVAVVTLLYLLFLPLLPLLSLGIVLQFSLDHREQIVPALQEAGMGEDEFGRLSPRLVEAVHVELNGASLTCLMKLLTLRCLKYRGRVVASKASLDLMMNSLPEGSHAIIAACYSS